MIFSSFIQAVLLLFIGLGFVYLASSIVRVPLRFLILSVLAVSIFGSYALTGASEGPAVRLLDRGMVDATL